jgi:glycosyltransferase involved in cell wall biosynthesis
MACGVPCIATDVGDASRIIGDCGIVVPPSDSEALGDGLRLLVGRSKEDRQHLGERARERIANEFHIDHSVARYEAFYTEIVHSG